MILTGGRAPIQSYLPQNLHDAIVLGVPLLTLLAGVTFFLMPRTMLNWAGLEARADNPEAIGEGRSTFAGFLIGLSLACLLLQEPGLQQPGLSFALAISWLVAAIGKALHIVVDGSRHWRTFIRFVIATVLGAAALWAAEPVSFSFNLPQSQGDWYSFLPAALALALGLLAFGFPKIALLGLRLQPLKGGQEAIGEIRGTAAGFYIGAGAAFLMAPGIFTGLLLGFCWTATAFGRLISILSDGGNTLRNWLRFGAEVALAGLPLGSVFGVFN